MEETSDAIARQLSSIRRKSGLRSQEIADLLNVRPESVSRWNQERVRPGPNARALLDDLATIVELLAFHYRPDQARQWWFSPQKPFGGETPAALFRQGREAEIIGTVKLLRERAIAKKERA